MKRKEKRQKIDKKKALSIALAVLNGVQANAPLAVPLAAAAKDAAHRETLGEDMLSLLNRGGQLTDRLFFATAHAATNTIPAHTTVTQRTVSGGDTLWVQAGGTVGFSGDAVLMPGQGGTLINSGRISGTNNGVYVNGGSSNVMAVAGGLVSGGMAGVYISDGSANMATISGGTVSGNAYGVYLLGGSANTATVAGGLVSGAGMGVYVSGGTSHTFTMSSGIVLGGANGIYLDHGGTNAFTVAGGMVSGANGIFMYSGGVNAVTVAGGTVSGGDIGVRILAGTSHTVTVNSGVVRGGSDGITVEQCNGNTVTVAGGTVSGGTNGVYVSGGSANAVMVTGGLVSAGAGYGVYFDGGSGNAVTVNGGTVAGGLYGIAAGGGSGHAFTVNGGVVSGGSHGIYLYGETGDTVTVNGGTVTGGTHGIMVEDGSGNTVNVAGGTVTNALISGTSNVLKVYGSGLVVDATVDTGALLNLSSGGTVAYTADNSLANLTAAGGKVLLAYRKTVGRTLTIGSLTGSADFAVNTNLAAGTADHIKITSATGSAANTLAVNYDPIYESGASATGSAKVATVTSGSASFTAAASDWGAYSYTPTLASTTDASGTTWSVTALTRNGGTSGTSGASETVRTAGDAIAGNMMLWRSENNNLTKRLGELRNATGEAGLWLRTYRGAEEIVSGGRTTKQQYTALQGGWDRKISRVDGAAYVGTAIGYLEGSSTYSRGGGEATSVSAGTYYSWLGKKGHFLDFIFKVSRLKNSYTNYLNNASNTKVDGGYETWGSSLSAEYGVRRQLAKGWYVEPQAEVTFSRINGANYTTSDGTAIHNDAVNSLTGRLGVAAGRNAGGAHYYGKVSLVREFAAKAGVKAANGTLAPVDTRQDLKENWLELAIGVTGKLGAKTDGYLELTRTTGEKAKTPWQVNLGARWNF